MRLIDADALIDDLMERYCKECNKRRGVKNGKYRIIYEIGEVPCRACEVDDVKAELEEAPTVSAERRGKWEWEIRTTIDSMHSYQQYRCSECDMTYITHTNFCPNCGAKMEEDDD